MQSFHRVLTSLALFLGILSISAQERNRARLTLQQGDPIPSVQGFDEQGKAFPLSKLRGSHTVIVFGCLT